MTPDKRVSEIVEELINPINGTLWGGREERDVLTQALTKYRQDIANQLKQERLKDFSGKTPKEIIDMLILALTK